MGEGEELVETGELLASIKCAFYYAIFSVVTDGQSRLVDKCSVLALSSDVVMVLFRVPFQEKKRKNCCTFA